MYAPGNNVFSYITFTSYTIFFVTFEMIVISTIVLQ